MQVIKLMFAEIIIIVSLLKREGDFVLNYALY